MKGILAVFQEASMFVRELNPQDLAIPLKFSMYLGVLASSFIKEILRMIRMAVF